MERTLLATERPRENHRAGPSVVEDYPHFLSVFTGLSSRDRGWRGIEAVRFRGRLRGESVIPHTHHVAMVYLGRPLEMRAKMGSRDQYRHLVEGDVTILPAGLPSQWGWRGDWSVDCLHMYLEPSFLEEVSVSTGVDAAGVEIKNVFGVRDPQVEQVGKSLLSELEDGGLMGDLYAQSLTNVLMIHLLRHHSSLGRRDARKIEREYKGALSKRALRSVTDYVGDNLVHDLTLEELAGIAHMSPYHFSRLFKRSTGLSPHQYVVRKRVERAKELLTNTDLSLHEVALSVGFADQSHLSRYTKRLLGVSPKSLR
jgi:AraC family transcriptional regulator